MAIDQALFAQECVRQGVFFRIEPHYMLGVARLRSGIADDTIRGEFGPFRLTQTLWDANRQNDEFDVHFTSAEVSSWRRQCVVFGLMAHGAFDAFVLANGRNPSAKELYLQQWPDAPTVTPPADSQKALDDTAKLVDPAADSVLDDSQSVSAIENPDTPATGPLKNLGPDALPRGGGARGSLTVAMLKRHWKRAAPELVRGMAGTSGVLTQLAINTPLRMAHFMAQISQECGNGTEMIEKLNYSAGRMMQVFPKRFPDMASTAGFANNERAFGNKVYNGRMGNRVGTDDGFNFRGRGCLQLTGRDSYNALGKSLGLDLVNSPDLVSDPQNVL